MRVKQTYTVQPLSVTFGDLVLKQDTVIEVVEVKNGEVTFINSEDLKQYTVSLYGLKFVVE